MKANPKIAPPGWEISQLLKMLQDRESGCQAPRESSHHRISSRESNRCHWAQLRAKTGDGEFPREIPKRCPESRD